MIKSTGSICFWLFIYFQTMVIVAQRSITSQVFDFYQNKPIEDVSVRVKTTEIGTYSDKYGNFSLLNLTDNVILVFSKIGYASRTLTIQDIGPRLFLTPIENSLDEVVLRGFSSSQLKKVAPDQIYFSKKDIERLPVILGEKDVIKLIQYTPGVQQATEGQSGLLVRGGNGSMNLSLLDNIYLHNTSHLGGLFSAVNADFVESLEFSKAGFDAEYGGRLSSVTDITSLKIPDSTQFKGSIGLLAAKITGNIKLNKKSNLVLSGRRTYLEAFKPFFKDSNSILGGDKNYFLHDYLGKYSLQLTPKDHIEVLAYVTKDDFTDQTKGRNRKLTWGNTLIGGTYKHQFSKVLNSTTTLANSYYKFSFSDQNFPFDYSAKSTFNKLNFSHYFLWKKRDFQLKLGASYNYNTTLPKQVNAFIESTPLEVLNQETFVYHDISSFTDIELPISKRIKIKTGLRLTTFLTQKNALVDSQDFYRIEPRFSVKYDFKKKNAFKFSYQKLNQFIHQASVSALSLPVDFFVVSTKDIKPQVSNQLSLGYIYEQNNFQLNSALYFKNVSNYTEFINGAINNLFTNNVYDDIAVGKFNSYGLEVSLQKKTKNITVQSAITLSKTIAQFDDINQGNYFPTTFDRPLNINTILQYKINKRWEVGGLFLFTSGQNFTRPNDIRIISEEPIINFESKNASRFPNYHRLDISCTYSFKKKKRWQSKLNLTIYNIYNNDNPFQIFYTTEGDTNNGAIEIIRNKETLFPVLPTLNWIFSF